MSDSTENRLRPTTKLTVQTHFTTTYGFNAIASQDVSSITSSGNMPIASRPPLALPLQPAAISASPTLRGHQNFIQASHQKDRSIGFGAPSNPPAMASSAPGPRSIMENAVGWKGLLEISRNSGHSGIVRPEPPMGRNSSDEVYGHNPRTVGTKGSSTSPSVEVCATAHTNAAIRRLVKSVSRGLTAEQEPEAAQEGMGGTYFFTNENGRKVAILKPCDEEPLAPNNPKGYVGRALGDAGWKPTVRVGEAAMREVAAYLLDRDFAKVPTSVLVRARHPIFCYNHSTANVMKASTNDLNSMAEDDEVMPMKLGSLQEFINHECDTSEMGASKFSVSDVHRIGILDIRLFNTDRHAGNMLVRQVKPLSSGDDLPRTLPSIQYELIPIDHGFCLPETLESAFFEWLHWPQAMLPFSEEELSYIKGLDIEADKELLQRELPNLRPECIRVLELSTTLLKFCAEAGMTLYEIGTLMSRPYVGGDEEPSELEKLCEEAKRSFMMQEIAECDEDSTSDVEEEDDFDNMDGGDENLMLVNFMGLVINAPTPKDALGNSYDSKDDDGPIFDIEGVQTPLSVLIKTPPAFSPMANPQLSPSQVSMVSSMSSTSPFNQAQFDRCAGESSRNLARSVNTSFMWRVSNRQTTFKRSRKSNKHSPQAYPPPVIPGKSPCGAGSSSSATISFSDFDAKEWHMFMQRAKTLIDQSIRQGVWKSSASDAGGIAMSCPRF